MSMDSGLIMTDRTWDDMVTIAGRPISKQVSIVLGTTYCECNEA